jgi:hypothetical protein
MTNPVIREINVQRWTIGSSNSQIVAALETAVGHPNLIAFSREPGAAQTPADCKLR